MNDKNLKRLIRLAQRTGDRLIIAGEGDDEPMVIMGLSDYEAMHDLITFSEGGDYEEGGYADDDLGVYDEMDSQDGMGDEYELPEEIFAPVAGSRNEEKEGFVLEEIVEVPQVVQNKLETEQKYGEIEETEGGEEQFYLEPIE